MLLFALALVIANTPVDGGVVEPPSAVSVHGAAELSVGVFPSGFEENGLDGMATLHPVVGFSVGEDFTLELGPTLRFRVIDTPGFNRPSDFGGVLRGPDWDELSDFGQILQVLRIAKAGGPFHVELMPVRKKTLGLGHLLWRYSNQTNPNYHPTGGRLAVQVGPVRGELFASDILGARLFAGELAWDLGRTFTPDVAVHDRYVLALSMAHDANLAGRPFRADVSVPVVTPAPITLLHLDFSAVLVRNATLRWMLLGGLGTRANLAADLGIVFGTTLDATVQEIGFSARLELRKQAGGFRHGFFGPMYELQRFTDLGYRGPSIGDAVLPDSFSGFAELKVGVGTRVSFELAAEYYFWNRLDLDGNFSLALLQDWLYLTVRSTIIGLAQAPRYAFSGGFRWRLFPSFYVLAEGGTVFFPQPDGSLVRGLSASAGVGVDFSR